MLRCGRDDDQFRSEFPEADVGFKALLAAVNRKRVERGESTQRGSKNGLPCDRNGVEQ